MLDHRLQHAVIAHIGPKPQLLVGLDGIRAGVLQLIGFDLVQQADTAAFLAQVEQGPPALLRNGLEGRIQLVTAIAAQAEQRIAGEAFGVDAG